MYDVASISLVHVRWSYSGTTVKDWPAQVAAVSLVVMLKHFPTTLCAYLRSALPRIGVVDEATMIACSAALAHKAFGAVVVVDAAAALASRLDAERLARNGVRASVLRSRNPMLRPGVSGAFLFR